MAFSPLFILKQKGGERRRKKGRRERKGKEKDRKEEKVFDSSRYGAFQGQKKIRKIKKKEEETRGGREYSVRSWALEANLGWNLESA